VTRIVTVVGARPQFVKAAVVSRAIQTHNAGHPTAPVTEILVHTGQHYDANMSEVFFEQMRIPKPDHHLGIGGGLHGAMTGRMLERLESLLVSERPDGVLIYGDTNSTLAGALAAAKLHIPVAHVEAGLRSFNMRMPEEVNRIVADRLSTLLFCPTDTARDNLAREGVVSGVHQVGDVMYDAVRYYREFAQPGEALQPLLDTCGDAYYLATVHRAGNTDDPHRLRAIMAALETLAAEVPVILPLHPRTRGCLDACGITPKRIRIIDPVGYFDMIALLEGCRAVLTDSGGLQKEAFFFEKPCITLRDETEWVELVSHGFNRLAGADTGRILEAVRESKGVQPDWRMPLYGTGDAGQRIVDRLVTR